MKEKQRLLGFDLLRGIAAYAVILVHSGDETWGIPVDRSAAEFRHLFYFAVPFFLATSFYFTTSKPNINVSRKFWLSRFQRILIPYLVWTILYLVFKVIIFSLTQETESLSKLLADPWAIVFLGGISYHLYFLPLLGSGYILLFFGKYLKKVNIKINIVLAALSILIYNLMLVYNNSFVLGLNLAFPEILELFQPNTIGYEITRLLLVELSWLLRCFPYLLVALLINNWKLNFYNYLFKSSLINIVLILTFILMNTIGKNLLPEALSEITIAYSLLLLAISISKIIKNNSAIINLGACSFGIYLIHPLVKSFIEIIIEQFLPNLAARVSIGSMLVYSGLTLILSWWIVSQSIRQKIIAKYMFGI